MTTETERDRLYAAILECPRTRNPPTRQVFDEEIEERKSYTMGCLSTRRCPMTLKGAAKVVGGYGPQGDQGRVLWRFRVVLNELVAEGQLIETHRPDGDDTYHIPGGTWDPVLVSPAEADLITDVLEDFRDDPRIAELVERLKLEATARSGRA